MALVTACGDDAAPIAADASVAVVDAPSPDAAPMVTMMMVDASGGELDAGNGISVAIPPGSVDTPTPITVTVTATPAPTMYANASPVVEFGPAGTLFAKPIEVSLPVVGSPTNPAIYWTKRMGTGYERIGGTLANGVVTAQVTHFSSGFVAETTTPTRTVQLTQTMTMIGGTTIRNEVSDLSQALIRVYVPNATGYDVLTGVGHTDGTATIADVPDGPYLLRLGNAMNYHARSASAIDIGLGAGGDGHDAATETTTVAINASNMTPWQDGDYLQTYSLAADTFYALRPDTTVSGFPANAATSLSDFTFDTSAAIGAPNLIKMGDVVTVAHMSEARTASNAAYTALREVFSTTMLGQTDGQSSTVTGSFTSTGGSTGTASFDYRGGAFAALVPTFAPATATVTPTYNDDFLWVVAHPRGAALCCLQGTVDLAVTGSQIGMTTVTGVMSFLIPGDATWDLYGGVMVAYDACRTAPGASAQACISVGLSETLPLATLTSGPITPVLTGPRNIRVDGMTLDSDRTGISLTPLIEWDPPTTGTPSYYRIQIRTFPSSGGHSQVGNLIVEGSQQRVRIPAGLLQPGSVYALRFLTTVEAISATTLFKATSPEITEFTSLTSFFSTN